MLASDPGGILYRNAVNHKFKGRVKGASYNLICGTKPVNVDCQYNGKLKVFHGEDCSHRDLLYIIIKFKFCRNRKKMVSREQVAHLVNDKLTIEKMRKEYHEYCPKSKSNNIIICPQQIIKRKKDIRVQWINDYFKRDGKKGRKRKTKRKGKKKKK